MSELSLEITKIDKINYGLTKAINKLTKNHEYTSTQKEIKRFKRSLKREDNHLRSQIIDVTHLILSFKEIEKSNFISKVKFILSSFNLKDDCEIISSFDEYLKLKQNTKKNVEINKDGEVAFSNRETKNKVFNDKQEVKNSMASVFGKSLPYDKTNDSILIAEASLEEKLKKLKSNLSKIRKQRKEENTKHLNELVDKAENLYKDLVKKTKTLVDEQAKSLKKAVIIKIIFYLPHLLPLYLST